MTPKKYLILLFYTFLAFSVHGQTLIFANDALTWGFLPEWDDFETNSFATDYTSDSFYTRLDYRIFTDRNISESDSTRIDSLLFKSLYLYDFKKLSKIDIGLRIGLSAQFFGDLGGCEIQGGWHKNVAVHREIPQIYNESFQQFQLPFELCFAFPLWGKFFLEIDQSISLPFEYSGKLKSGFEFPSIFIPLSIGGAYSFRTGGTDSSAYEASMSRVQGWFIFSDLEFWPLLIRKTYYIDQKWGSGSVGLVFILPQNPPPENMLLQLNLIAFTHMATGEKISREILNGTPLPASYSSIYYKNMTGWTDADYSFPEGERYSSLSIGIEEGVQFSFGSFRTDLYLAADSGLEQNQYYDLNSTALTPIYTQNSLIFELGLGARLLTDFFSDRKIGVGFEFSRKWNILSNGEWPESIAAENPYNYILSFIVSS